MKICRHKLYEHTVCVCMYRQKIACSVKGATYIGRHMTSVF